jgi:hypothetical protein
MFTVWGKADAERPLAQFAPASERAPFAALDLDGVEILLRWPQCSRSERGAGACDWALGVTNTVGV